MFCNQLLQMVAMVTSNPRSNLFSREVGQLTEQWKGKEGSMGRVLWCVFQSKLKLF